MGELVTCDICRKQFSIKGIGSHKWRMHGPGRSFNPRSDDFVPWNKGLTKETSESVRLQAESLRRKKSDLEKKLDDDGKLIQRWRNKRVNAEQEGVKCLLSFDEYCQLVDRAGLVSSQLGFTGDKYVLARYGDKGDYTIDNCRFTTQLENAKERTGHTIFTRIRCLQDGKVFNSIVSAAEYYNVTQHSIAKCLRESVTHYSIGLKFERF